MPQKSTRSPGAITSCRRFVRAASSAARSGRTEDIAARLLVRLKPDQSLLARLLEQIRERAVAVVGLVEPWVTALQRLLHHRAPDLLVCAALGDERLERAEQEIERLLLLVLPGRPCVLALLCRPSLLLLGAHQVVVVDEL